MKGNAEWYDNLIWRAVPNYRECLELVERLIPIDAKRILNIGTGTGNLEKVIFEARPDISITGIDVNEEYMSHAEKKLAGYDFCPIIGNAKNVSYPKADCVVSALTMHHIGEEEKDFEKIERTGANAFVNFDIVKGGTTKEHDKFIDYLINHFIMQGLPSEFIADERRVLNGIGEGADMPITYEYQKGIVERLGFQVDLYLQNKLFVVYSASR